MNSPFQRNEESKEISEVNIVPLADVSLVLLIILMVLSPMMSQSMLMVKAAAQAKPIAEVEPEPLELPKEVEPNLIVNLRPDAIIVNGQPFRGMAVFVGHMAKTLTRRKDKKVFLSPHGEVSNGRVVHMLELLKQCGAESVALVQTEQDDSTAPEPLPVPGLVPAPAPRR